MGFDPILPFLLLGGDSAASDISPAIDTRTGRRVEVFPFEMEAEPERCKRDQGE
jgi:hypothetical protein